MTLEEDYFEVGTGTPDAARFIRPEAETLLTGNMVVRLLSWDRVSWTVSSESRTVLSRSGNTLTLSSAFTANPHQVHFLIPAEFDTQDAAATNYVRNLSLPILNDEKKFGAGPTNGFPFIDD